MPRDNDDLGSFKFEVSNGHPRYCCSRAVTDSTILIYEIIITVSGMLCMTNGPRTNHMEQHLERCTLMKSILFAALMY